MLKMGFARWSAFYVSTILTFLVGKCTEGAPGAIARVLDVVTLGRLVNLGMELLLRSANSTLLPRSFLLFLFAHLV